MSSGPLVRVAAGMAVGFAGLACFVAVAGDVPGDDPALTFLSSADALVTGARIVDRWTGYLPMSVLTALLVLVLVSRHRTRTGVLAVAAVGGTILGNVLLKRLVARPRPELLSPFADVSEFSFPSGHAAATAAVAVVVVLVMRRARWVVPVLLSATLLVAVAALAQLVLALHHPSDVVAGWMWAAGWTSAVWGCFDGARGRPPGG